MKPKFILFLLSIALCYACETRDPQEQMEQLGGYWAIEKAIMPDGSQKEFSISTTVDFIEVNGTEGVRKKVQPKLDGTFTTGKQAETFQLKVEDDSLRMYYKTPYDSWKETVLTAKENQLVVLNRDGIRYFYKPFEKFNFE